MTARVPVTFLPSGATAWVSSGETVLTAARKAGVPISASCAGRGTCGECGIRVAEGALSAIEAVEERGLARAPAGVRLACQARIEDAVTVRPLISLGVRPPSGGAGGGTELVAGVDLGTTTVNAVVVDRVSGREIGHATVVNEQASWGADVLSRLSAALDGEGSRLREAAERSIAAALDTAAPGTLSRISRLVVAGNTAMSALLAGADVSSLATHPFAIPGSIDRLLPGSRLATELATGARIDLVPALASFVGGDVLAGLIATGIRPGSPRAVMLVDVGTNAEVVLAGREDLFVASAAAGPAFEGGGLTCGGPAVGGAVTAVRLSADGAIELDTLGNAPARWFSGAGLISALAVLQSAGHVDHAGLLDAAGPFESRFSRDGDGVLGVNLGEGAACLRLSQLDVRALQLAKAAVRTAIEMVLKRAGVQSGALEALHVAGAFGRALKTTDLVNLGVVPREAQDAVHVVGNSALAGAVALALDDGLWDEVQKLTGHATQVELASDPAFNAMLMNALELQPFSG